MTAKELQKAFNIEVEHAMYDKDGKWYHHLKAFPGALFDRDGYVIFNSIDLYQDNHLLQHGKHLHVKGQDTIKNLKGYKLFSEVEKAKIDVNNVLSNKNISQEALVRQLRIIEVIKRNQKFVSSLKKMYDNTCQLCGLKIKIRQSICYSEVHHIQPLGTPHNGPDIIENMICVCPNCHVMLDLGAKDLKMDSILIKKHLIADSFISYHNSLIYLKSFK